MKKFYSFDVFDTLITRKVAEPKGIFLIMQESLSEDFPSLFRNQFLAVRTAAESYLRKHSGNTEVLFDDIYEFIWKNWGLTFEQSQFIKELEIKTELECSVAIKCNISKVKDLLRANEKVVLISDMYLPQNIIRSLLCKHDSIFEDIVIYASSDCQKCKYTGELFKFIRKKENIEFSQWKHFGDNKSADFKVPKKLGIKTELYKFEKLKPYEKKFIKKYAVSQLLIGTARNLRLLECNGNKKMEMGCSFSGPILYSYVSWVLETAIANKIKGLHFVMRDGFILKQIADIIIAKKNIEIKTALIYSSRLAWRDKNNEQILLDYLKQEINFSESFAFVDISANGPTHFCVNEILKKASLSEIPYFYFASWDVLWKNSLVFNFMPGRSAGILEPLLRSLEGQLISFERKNEKIVPILDTKETQGFLCYKYNDYIEGVILFSKKISNFEIYLYKSSLCFEYKEYLESYNIDRELAELYGLIPYLDESNRAFTIVAPTISFFDDIIGLISNNNYGYMLNIRIARSNFAIRILYRLCKGMKNIIKKFIEDT